ncbi:MAG TPA: peptidoglycan-binding domain-containing protein [Archangium sp.]|nr:peptidoglycan-binding domain-containing protein [Archangium sp.]
MKVHQLFISGALIIGALSLPAVAAAASPAAPTCNSWSDDDFFTPSRLFIFHIPSTTRDGRQFNCVLRPGDRGAGVFILQDALIKCYSQKITHDAIYGKKTAEAVANVQRFHKILDPRPNLAVDGVYGPDTMSAMEFGKYEVNDGPFSSCFFGIVSS